MDINSEGQLPTMWQDPRDLSARYVYQWRPGRCRRLPSPSRQFLNGERFDPETTRIMGVAFEAARIALRLADRGDAFAPIVAKRIIELAKGGERNPNVLCEAALEAWL